MKSSPLIYILKLISYLGLVLSVVPGFLVFYQVMSLETYKMSLLIGTALWLLTGPFWINRRDNPIGASDELPN